MNVGDEVLLLLLKRVHDGHVSERFGFYFDDSEQICYWVNHVYMGLICMRRIELIYPPDSGARRRKFVPRGLVECSQLGLTEAEVTRRVVLTERGLAEYKELCERQRARVRSAGHSATPDPTRKFGARVPISRTGPT